MQQAGTVLRGEIIDEKPNMTKVKVYGDAMWISSELIHPRPDGKLWFSNAAFNWNPCLREACKKHRQRIRQLMARRKA